MVNYLQIFLDIGQRSLDIYLGVGLGYLFIKSPLGKYRKLFVDITINFFTPYLIFISLIGIELDGNWFYPVLGAILVTIFGLTVPRLWARIFSQEEPSSAEIATSTFSNALNFPFPIIFAFAPNGLGLAGIFLALSIIARNTIGFWISGVKVNKESFKIIALFPPIWAILVGGMMRLTINDQISFITDYQVVDILFEIGIWATLMTVGFGLKKPNWEYKDPIIRVSMSRYVISGIAGFLIVFITKIPQFVAVPFVVQLMAPPAVYNGLYAEKFGLDTDLTSQIIVTLTVIALIILPLELFALEYLL